MDKNVFLKQKHQERGANQSFVSRYVKLLIRPIVRLYFIIRKHVKCMHIPIISELHEIKAQLNLIERRIRHEVVAGGDIKYQDIMEVLAKINPIYKEHKVIVKTDFPVAKESNDHLFPEGTAVDNTRSPGFCRTCEIYFGRKISYLDVGCSGGGLVLDFLLRGHFAIGLEGSDYSLKTQRAVWRLIPDNLYTADITKPFQISGQDSCKNKQFDVISSWEVLEHICKENIDQTFQNILCHLSDEGIFIGSIGTEPSFHGESGTSLHMTVEEPDWWIEKMYSCGFEPMLSHPFEYKDFCRGSGNGISDPDYKSNPIGFHFVMQKRR